ncbi:solute carrier family 45, member 1/2/4 [Geosmithia morbida]|uniref:Solute carrier family 45, member 1/2/4 n=1 Tax=Geosmithia morbida TaxID=1094350 RepID=A0A9P4YVE4_9HYPO|nr:solute carrier family 45, member 1/2/4 [Geosmithia morbida]KAF4122398.1 solute carrier family 45, member 1/2/4 [Geosmithia morbida]
MAKFTGEPSVMGGSELLRMVLLTFVAVGITFTWSIEMTYCTPYLLNLGLTKSNTALVWIAGPLSGLVVQPIVGVVSDQSTSRWGRRKPLMVVGTTIVAVCLVTLGFTRDIIKLFVGDDEDAVKQPSIVLAVFSIYALDFAINAVSRMSAVGHLLGYAAGAIDLLAIFGKALGSTQFQQLCILAIFFVLVTNAITCFTVTEKIQLPDLDEPKSKTSGLGVFREIWSTFRTLPPRIRAICWAQFWSWIGWFPFLFYSTTWVGETYFRYNVPDDAKDSKDVLGDMGRVGSTALVLYSSVTLIGSVVLPPLVKSPEENKSVSEKEDTERSAPGFVKRLNNKLGVYKPTLLNTWIAGHFMFSGAMAVAPFAASVNVATALVCLCGLPWTLAMWVPVALLGIEVNKVAGSGAEGESTQYRRLSDASDEDLELNNRRPSAETTSPYPEDNNRPSVETSLCPENNFEKKSPDSSDAELSGVYFGILNIFTTLPQLIASFISTVVFAILEPGESPELAHKAHPDEQADTGGPNAISICLFIGAISTFYAAFATRRLKSL